MNENEIQSKCENVYEFDDTDLFSKLQQMLAKKAKMALWRLCIGGTLILTRAFCISGLSLVVKTFTRP